MDVLHWGSDQDTGQQQFSTHMHLALFEGAWHMMNISSACSRGTTSSCVLALCPTLVQLHLTPC